ncbi:MAG: hypothetical protein C0621_08055 [Desulfuromonas sp.]|nr:MAG: hypothetical protein C0621_08055 [Desulfuromonas sp.]
MKKLVFALCLSLAAAAATVSTAAAAIEVTGDAYVGVADKYLWRGYELSGNTPVVQGGMDLSFSGITLSYWTNAQITDDGAAGLQGGEANETDVVVDYSFDASDMLSVSVGNILYALDGAADTNELYVGLGLNTILAPSLTVYHDWDEFKNDRVFALSIGHDIEAGPLALSVGALANYADNTANEIWNTELSLGASYPVTDQISLDASFIHSEPYGDDAKAAIDAENVGSFSVALSF